MREEAIGAADREKMVAEGEQRQRRSRHDDASLDFFRSDAKAGYGQWRAAENGTEAKAIPFEGEGVLTVAHMSASTVVQLGER